MYKYIYKNTLKVRLFQLARIPYFLTSRTGFTEGVEIYSNVFFKRFVCVSVRRKHSFTAACCMIHLKNISSRDVFFAEFVYVSRVGM